MSFAQPPNERVGTPGVFLSGGGDRRTAELDGPLDGATTGTSPRGWATVPWYSILATIGIVFAVVLVAVTAYVASRIVVWVVVAGFFAVVLARPVAFVERATGFVGASRSVWW